MNDFELDTESHDLIIENGNLKLLNTEAKVAAQTLKINLLTLLGEYFANTTLGIPYVQEIFKKGTTKDRVDNIFRVAALNSYNIQDVVKLVSYITPEGIYTISELQATTLDGDIISISNLQTT